MRHRDDVRHREEEPRARLWQRAAGQRGYFTAAQAREDGYSYPLQHFHTQRGNWLRIDHGLYRFGEYADLPAEDNDYLIRWALWSGGRAVVSHATALGVHDLGIANPAEIHLTVPPGFRKRDAAVVVHRAHLEPDDVEEREGFRVTTPVRAIAESAADGIQQDAIDSAVADLLDRGGATRGQLLQAAQRAGKVAELAVERALHAERA
jgi:predicted transcriptional regulator of viral defense system